MAKAGKGALRLAGSTITSGQTMLQPLRFTLQPGVVTYTDGVRQAEKLAKFIEQGRGETSDRPSKDNFMALLERQAGFCD